MSDTPTSPEMAAPTLEQCSRHVCPWWVGHLMISPIRRLFEHPERILSPHVRDGQTVVDLGCAMGYFSLPLARLVGPRGRVLCIDIQQRMIDQLSKRARRAGLGERIEAWVCPPEDVLLARHQGQIDFVLAFHVVHELPDIAGVLGQVFQSLKSGGHMLMVEPRHHVSRESFEEEVTLAQSAGFHVQAVPTQRGQLGMMLVKP